MSVVNEKRASGAAIASRLTMSDMAIASARSDFKNLSRAGVAAKRSRASTLVPIGAAQGSIALLIPSSTTIFKAVGAPRVRVRISSRDTEAIEGSASPRKPKVAIAVEIAVGDFRRRVPLDAQGEIGFVHAAPVVGDADEPTPAGLDRDLDPFRPGVERVLDQLLRPPRPAARSLRLRRCGRRARDRDGESAWGEDLAEIIALAGERGKRASATAVKWRPSTRRYPPLSSTPPSKHFRRPDPPRAYSLTFN